MDPLDLACGLESDRVNRPFGPLGPIHGYASYELLKTPVLARRRHAARGSGGGCGASAGGVGAAGDLHDGSDDLAVASVGGTLGRSHEVGEDGVLRIQPGRMDRCDMWGGGLKEVFAVWGSGGTLHTFYKQYGLINTAVSSQDVHLAFSTLRVCNSWARRLDTLAYSCSFRLRSRPTPPESHVFPEHRREFDPRTVPDEASWFSRRGGETRGLCGGAE